MTYKDDSLLPNGRCLPQDAKKEGETLRQVTGQKAIKRTRHSFYLDTGIIRSLDHAFKQTHHELYPAEISKSEFLEECVRYALSYLHEIKCNLMRDE